MFLKESLNVRLMTVHNINPHFHPLLLCCCICQFSHHICALLVYFYCIKGTGKVKTTQVHTDLNTSCETVLLKEELEVINVFMYIFIVST